MTNPHARAGRGGSTRGATCIRRPQRKALRTTSMEANGSGRLPYDGGCGHPCGSETRGEFSAAPCRLAPAAGSLTGCFGYLSLGNSLESGLYPIVFYGGALILQIIDQLFYGGGSMRQTS